MAACDHLDGVTDGVLRDPRACNYSAAALVCPAAAAAAGKARRAAGCLTLGEAKAVDQIWKGSVNRDGSLSWYGIPRGASFSALANKALMSIPAGQANSRRRDCHAAAPPSTFSW